MITRKLVQRPNRLLQIATSSRYSSSVSRGQLGEYIPQPQGNTSTHRVLERDPDRPLPSLPSLSSSRRWLRTLPIFFAIIAGSALGIFNYQKVNSPVITATLYSLRTNQDVRDLLGDEVYFASKWAWIWGEINLVQGRIDVKFKVKGTKQQGWCRFKAQRFGGRSGSFKTTEWSLTPENGEPLQLLNSYRGDPLAGAAF